MPRDFLILLWANGVWRTESRIMHMEGKDKLPAGNLRVQVLPVRPQGEHRNVRRRRWTSVVCMSKIAWLHARRPSSCADVPVLLMFIYSAFICMFLILPQA